MANAEYGKVKLSLILHFNEYNKFRLLLDGKEPMDFEIREKQSIMYLKQKSEIIF